LPRLGHDRCPSLRLNVISTSGGVMVRKTMDYRLERWIALLLSLLYLLPFVVRH
jgi:hypothetical protein